MFDDVFGPPTASYGDVAARAAANGVVQIAPSGTYGDRVASVVRRLEGVA